MSEEAINPTHESIIQEYADMIVSEFLSLDDKARVDLKTPEETRKIIEERAASQKIDRPAKYRQDARARAKSLVEKHMKSQLPGPTALDLCDIYEAISSDELAYHYAYDAPGYDYRLLAEEAVELAQASLKLLRIVDGTARNGTIEDGIKALAEEYADVTSVAAKLFAQICAQSDKPISTSKLIVESIRDKCLYSRIGRVMRAFPYYDPIRATRDMVLHGDEALPPIYESFANMFTHDWTEMADKHNLVVASMYELAQDAASAAILEKYDSENIPEDLILHERSGDIREAVEALAVEGGASPFSI